MGRKKTGLFDQTAYIEQYIRENLTRKMITFNKKKPEDVARLKWLESQPEGMIAYLKKLIDEDMTRDEVRRETRREAYQAGRAAAQEVTHLSFPAIDGWKDEAAIREWKEKGHRLLVHRQDWWEVRIDVDAKKVLTVTDLRHLKIT